MPNLNNSLKQPLSLNRRDRYALFLKQARQLRDKGIALDVENIQNFKFNKDKGIFDIYDVNPSYIAPSQYMSYIHQKTKNNLFKLANYRNGGKYIEKYQLGAKFKSHQDSVQHQADKILKYEQLRGSASGGPLSYFKDPQYMDMLMKDIYPEVNKILPNASAMEKGEVMDFIFNAG
jgi:hypothetical protein